MAQPSSMASAVLGRAGAMTSTAKIRPAAPVNSTVRGVTGFTSRSIIATTSASGVNREIDCIVSDAAAMVRCLTLWASDISVYLNKAADRSETFAQKDHELAW